MMRIPVGNRSLLLLLFLTFAIGCGHENASPVAPSDRLECSAENLSGTCDAGQSCFRGECMTPDARHYQSDPVPDRLSGIYGAWVYGKEVGHLPPDFGELRLKPYGVFGCVTDGSVLLSGKFELFGYTDYDEKVYDAVRLIPDDPDKKKWPRAVYWSTLLPMLISLTQDDSSLSLILPFGEAPSSHFVRADAS